MSLTKFLLLLLQLMLLGRLSELSQATAHNQNYRLEIGGEYTQAPE